MSSAVGVSVVFTDLVDSTALASSLGATEADELRRAHFALLRGPVARNGGREVKTLGDGIMAVFSGVGAALDAAVAMQQAVDRHNRAAPGTPLSIRIGVATGDCVEENGDYFGEPVVQAARLCARADGGRILAPEIARTLAPRGHHEFTLLGELQLKGLPEPVATVEVRWEPLEIDDSGPTDATGAELPRPVPLPDRLAITPQFGFVGRDRERDVLRDAWKAMGAGERRVVLLSGEAGLGKTCISTDLAREGFEAGQLVLYGRCEEELASPYRPWVEALAHYVTFAGTGGIAALGSRALGDLAVLVPALRDHAPIGSVNRPAGGDGDQYALYAAVTAVLSHLAQVQPVVIVLDDLHWADRATLRLLQHVVAQITTGRLMIVGTYRDTDIGADDPLTATLAAMRREVGVERVDLDGLSDVEILTMLETVAGHGMDAQGVRLAHALREETGGNPFFVGEMLRHLAESGAIAQRDDGRWVATVDLDDVGLPQSVREVVGARVRRLGDDAHQVLAAAAVVGRDFDAALAAAAVGVDAEVALEILETALAAGLVAEVPGFNERFTFTHALVQHTLYQDLRRSRRVRLHRTIAETIESLVGESTDDRVGELASHWFAATRPAEIDKTIGYGIRAGDQAIAARAPDDAVRWYRQALDAISESELRRRCDVMIRLGDAQRQAGEAEFREILLAAAALAQRLGAGDLLVRAALANNRGWHSRTGVTDTDRIAVLEAALAFEPHDSASRASLLALLAVELSSAGDEMLERRLALADEAVAVARRVGDPATLARVLDAGVFSTWIPERLNDRLAWVEEAVRFADTVEDPALDYWVSSRRKVLALETQDRPTYETYRQRQVALAARLGQPVMRWHTTYFEGTRAFLNGDLEGAEAFASEALELGFSSGQPDALSYYGAQLVTIRLLQGRLGELEDLIRQQAEANPGIPSFRVALASLCADGGRHDEAIEMLADDVASGFSRFPNDPMRFVNLTGAARVAAVVHEAGDSARAAVLANALHDVLAPWSDRVIHIEVIARPPVAHSLGQLDGVLGRDDDADDHFATALDVATRIQAPLFAAMTRVELGALRLDRGRGDPDEARALVSDGLATAVAARAGGIERRAREVIERSF